MRIYEGAGLWLAPFFVFFVRSIVSPPHQYRLNHPLTPSSWQYACHDGLNWQIHCFLTSFPKTPWSVLVLESIDNPVGLADVFFSTTDAKGHIELSNDVFVRLSKYPLTKLHGAPHNIIRHEDMPAGVFALMWDTLHAGQAFAGYVRNKAADGSAYDVLATVTPLPDGGYLSVRTRPVLSDVHATALQLYSQMLEEEAAAEGGRAKIAAESAAGLPAKLNVDSYRHFVNRIFPQEIALREEQVAAEGGDHLATSGPLAEVYQILSTMMDKQDQVLAIIEALSQANTQLEAEASKGEHIAEIMQSLDIDPITRTLALAPLSTWVGMHSIVGDYLTELNQACADLVELSHETRFTVALARLHATQTMHFVSTPQQLGSPSQEAIPMLVDAMRQDIEALAMQLETYRRMTKRMANRISSVVRIMAPSQHLLTDWVNSADTTVVGEDLLGTARQALNSTETAMQDMTALAEKLNGAPAYDAEDLRHMTALVLEVR